MRMKKQIIYPILGLCASFFFTACGDDDYNQTDFTRPAGGNQIVLHCQSELDGNKTSWNADSKVGFFCEQTNTKNLSVGLAAPSVGETKGLFYTKVNWGKGEHTLYAYTPYNRSNTSEKSIAGILSNSQSQNGNSKDHLTSTAITYSVVKTTEIQDAITMDFKHALGYLDVCCTTDKKFAGWKIKSIELSTTDNISLAGKYKFDLTTEKLSITEGFDKIVLRTNKASEIIANETFHGYLSVNPIDLTGKKCNVRVIVEKPEELDRQLTGSIDGILIKASQINSIEINLDNLDEDFLEDRSIDLSKDETANCYVAGKAGQEYRFNATIMGNGATTPAVEGDIRYKGIYPTALNPASAAILWQSDRNLLTGVKLKNGYIYFTLNGSKDTPLKSGNAVIAAYDTNETIIWSWHIWVTDVDLDAKAQTYTNIHKDYSKFPDFQSPIVMDRNLGATDNRIWATATDTKDAHGLFYQWGRKDPIIGPSTENASAFATIYDGDNNVTNFEFTAVEAIKREDIAKYPMRYVKGDNWFAEDAYDLWGNSATYQADGGDGTTGSKSIYDPCPPGYRVPHAYIWSGFTSKATGGKHKDGTVTTTASGDITQQGGVTFENGGTIIYPSTGFINQGALQRVSPAENGCISLWSNAGAKSKFSSQFYYDATNCNTPKANKRTFGFGVRCIKDKAK